MSEAISTQTLHTPPSHTTVSGHRQDGAARPKALSNLRPLLLDIAVPVGSYYLLRDALGVSLVLSLSLSSVVPAVRTAWSGIKERRINGLAGLMLAVNIISLVLSFVAGNPRIILAKDSGVSSVVGITMLVSAFTGKPLMSAGLKPWLVKGDPAKSAAWDRLAAGSQRFQRLERRFSMIWGLALLAECVARLVGAFTLPIATMVWMGSVLTGAGILAAMLVGGAATLPMDKMLSQDVEAEAERVTA